MALLFGFNSRNGILTNSVRMMLASEQDITLPLFGFNVGLELGQIVVSHRTIHTLYFLGSSETF